MEKELASIRNALEEHLNAINENTSEIQAMFDYLQEVETKIERLSQRLDQLQLQQETKEKSITPLTRIEQQVFLALYTEEIPLSYYEIAVKTQLPLAVTQETVAALARKGVPLVRSFVNEQLFLRLEPKFKEKQAKENVINLSLQSFLQ